MYRMTKGAKHRGMYRLYITWRRYKRYATLAEAEAMRAKVFAEAGVLLTVVKEKEA